MIYEPDKGDSIYLAASKAVRQAYLAAHEVVLRFNEIDIHVSASSNPDDIAMIYSLKCELRRLKA